MRFKLPEDLSELSIEKLDELYAAALAESQELAALDDADLTDEKLADLEAIGGHLDTITARRAEVVQAEADRTARLAAARGKVTEASAPVEEPNEDEDGGEDEGEEDDGDGDDSVEVPDDASELVEAEEKELVTASASRPAGAKRSVVRTAANKTTPDLPTKPLGAVLTAAANLPQIAASEKFASLGHASKIWGEFASKGSGGSQRAQLNFKSGDINDVKPVMALSKNHTRLGFAKITKPENSFGITEGMTVEQQLQVIDEVANERTRFGSGGLAKAVLASGGWCAPSPTVYDFCSYETVSGILDVPTLNMPRGGINYTKGPDYASLAADWGFIQTEAEAEAGTEKECYAVECPPFLETRLDAIGFCITAGVLTNAAYPELIRRVLEIGAVAHAHKVNAYVINKISTMIGTAISPTGLGSASVDILDALDLQAMRIRYSLAMDENATLEAVFPIWAKAIFRADLARRTGVLELAVSDAQINSYLAARNIRAQFVYDYQPLTSTSTGTWTSLPDTLEFMVYPAGAFVKGELSVIDLDTIYDSVGLSTNTYTAAFFEEGAQVFNRCGFGVKVSLDVTCLAGVTGAAELSCIPTIP